MWHQHTTQHTKFEYLVKLFQSQWDKILKMFAPNSTLLSDDTVCAEFQELH